MQTPQRKRAYYASLSLGFLIFIKGLRNFLDGLVVKTSPSNAGGAGLIPNWGDTTPHASVAKKTKLK